MNHPRSNRKSGQAIIFLMVVVVVGLLVVIWNFDLHRVVSAKLRIRNTADAAALAAARWQGLTLNVIGDLNLIQAALITDNYVEYIEAWQEWVQNGRFGEEPLYEDFIDTEQYTAMHEMRSRLEYVGPLAAYAVAQQTAFNNGAFHDPELAANLFSLADEIRSRPGRNPYDNANKDYAELLEQLAESGVAVSSYSLRLPRHPLVQKSFYAAIAQGLANWWCPFRRYRHLLDNYEGFDSWGTLDTEFRYNYMLDLKLDEFVSDVDRNIYPGSALVDPDDYSEEFDTYLEAHVDHADSGLTYRAMHRIPLDSAVHWHIYGSSWAQEWPRASYYNDETGEEEGQFPIRTDVKDEFNYMGADAGIGISVPLNRGILGSSDNETLDLTYKTKAKPFGYLVLDDALVPPNYFGFVLPAFREVRLIHSDIGSRVLDAVFYRHITQHLEPYLDQGPSVCDPKCTYCQLLVKWESMDRAAGRKWLEDAENDPDNNPCDPPEKSDPSWGKAGGGATGGS